jgi:hypothetical protein
MGAECFRGQLGGESGPWGDDAVIGWSTRGLTADQGVRLTVWPALDGAFGFLTRWAIGVLSGRGSQRGAISDGCGVERFVARSFPVAVRSGVPAY